MQTVIGMGWIKMMLVHNEAGIAALAGLVQMQTGDGVA